MNVAVQLAEQIADLLNASAASYHTELSAMQVASVLLSEAREAARDDAVEVEEPGVPVADSLQSPGDDR